MTHLGNNLYADLVPLDAKHFVVRESELFYKTNLFGLGEVGRIKKLPHNGFKYKGTVTLIQINFDCENFVDLFQITRLNQFGYKNYEKSKDNYQDYTCKTKEESFVTLLKSKGIEPTEIQKIILLQK